MDDLKNLSNEDLAALRNDKEQAFDTAMGVENPTMEQIEAGLVLADEVGAVVAEIDRREEAAKRFADIKEQRAQAAEEGESEGDESEGEQEGDESEGSESEGSEDAAEGAEGEASAKASAREALASQAKRPKPPEESGSKIKPLVITAAADVPQFSSGQELGDDLLDVAKAVINRARGFGQPTGDGQSVDLRQFGTAMFEMPYDPDLVVNDPHEAQEVFARAADETRLPNGSLVAAGGWCAPSETDYSLVNDSTEEGLLSLPEVQVRRGGIRYAQSPVFADFYANPGFVQTEAQAIAGTSKPCVEVTCPTFTEVRLDVEGLCIKVPILTNAAYPEVVRNFVQGTMTAHAHWINANVVGRVVTIAGTARTITGIGSTVADTLGALTLIANQRRQQIRASMNRSFEVVVPFWLKDVLRDDLELRTGQLSPVSDGQLNAYFAARKLNVQFIYDWQALPQTDVGGTAGKDEANTYPDSFEVLMYPAGTLVRGTAPVITLNTVYDAASLATNVYTGLFTEQGLLVAKMKDQVDRVTIPICSSGRVGAQDLTCATGAWNH